MTDANAIRMQRLVHHQARELFVFLSQQDGRPLSADLIRMVREYGLRCYREGTKEAASERWLDQDTAPTLPPPTAAAKMPKDIPP